MASHACCAAGEPMHHEYSEEGKFVDVDGTRTYITGSSRRVVLITTDIFGLDFKQARFSGLLPRLGAAFASGRTMQSTFGMVVWAAHMSFNCDRDPDTRTSWLFWHRCVGLRKPAFMYIRVQHLMVWKVAAHIALRPQTG
jgi:hypothetical protein